MKNTCRVLTLLAVLLFAHGSAAADDTRIASRAKIIADKFRKDHLSPPKLDDAFGQSVHRLVMDFLDPEKMVFTQEDTEEFERLALAIDEDIEQQKTSYLSAVEQRFRLRIGELTGILNTYLEKPVALNSTLKKNRSDYDAYSFRKQHAEQFRQELQLRVMSAMLDALPETAAVFPKDSITGMETSARNEVRETYRLFFSRLQKNDELMEEVYLNAITLSFDPHSSYFSPSDKQTFEQELSSDREVYGFNIGKNTENELILSEIVPGSPAWLSNQLHDGDVLEAIRFEDGPEIKIGKGAKTPDEVHDLFRKALVTTVTLTVTGSDGKEQTVSLAKAPVYSDSDVIKNAVLKAEKKIGYITLPDFYVNWTDTSELGCANDLAKCLLKLKKENVEGLILDLRGNGGGSLKEAVDLSGIFIDYGPVVAMKDKTGTVTVLKDFNRGAIYSGPFIVMIDEGSASASEVVAGVLQDYNKALIVGRRSYGKATSQIIVPLDPAYNAFSAMYQSEDPAYGYVNITTGGLYRVTRKWNQRAGITPDLVLPFDYGTPPETERDYPNAVRLDSIAKKMTFTPDPALPIAALNQLMNNRMASDQQLLAYSALLKEANAFEQQDTVIVFSLDAQLKLRNEWEAILHKIEAFSDGLKLNFEPVPNQFDEEVYRANAVLRDFNDHFLDQLKTDVELVETVTIMLDLIRIGGK